MQPPHRYAPEQNVTALHLSGSAREHSLCGGCGRALKDLELRRRGIAGDVRTDVMAAPKIEHKAEWAEVKGHIHKSIWRSDETARSSTQQLHRSGQNSPEPGFVVRVSADFDEGTG